MHNGSLFLVCHHVVSERIAGQEDVDLFRKEQAL